jgi:hypothetical protein
MRRSIAGLSLLIAVSAAACTLPGATVESTSTPAASAEASPSGEASGGRSTARPSLPAVPDGLPEMPGAVAADPPSVVPGVIAGWMVDAIGPEVYAFYIEALPAAGFAIQERLPGGNVAVIRFTTPDGDTLELALVGEHNGEQTRIGLRLPEKP